jgi:hypothetical protein
LASAVHGVPGALGVATGQSIVMPSQYFGVPHAET